MKNQYEIIYMKADFEPWWQFEGWEDYIMTTWSFDTKESFEAALEEKLQQMRAKYPKERQSKQFFYAFWDESEQEYCEGCDEDTQVFHGIITKIPSYATAD